MEDELVRRRQWLSREKFLDLLGASNLIPGPSSSELANHIGYLCGGWRGLLIAGSCFILPAALMVAGIGWLHDSGSSCVHLAWHGTCRFARLLSED
jgi:chromate transporter